MNEQEVVAIGMAMACQEQGIYYRGIQGGIVQVEIPLLTEFSLDSTYEHMKALLLYRRLAVDTVKIETCRSRHSLFVYIAIHRVPNIERVMKMLSKQLKSMTVIESSHSACAG